MEYNAQELIDSLRDHIGEGLPKGFPSEVLDDEDFIFEAIGDNSWVIRYASKRLLQDRDFVSKAILKNPEVLVDGMNVPEFKEMGYHKDRMLVMDAVQGYGLALAAASDELRADRDIVMTALDESNPHKMVTAASPLRYASKELRLNPEVITFAVKNNAHAIECLLEESLNDRDLILSLVKVNPAIYDMLPSRYHNDRGMTLIAVKHDGVYLCAASDELKDDKEIVEIALRNHGSFDVRDLFEYYTSKRLQEDPELQSLVDDIFTGC